MSNRLSLAQQLAQLEDTAPVDFDPEDAHFAGADPSDEDEGNGQSTAARDHYVEVGPSAIRKLHAPIAEPKYDGVSTTRSQLLAQNASDGSDTDGDGDDIRHEASEDDSESQTEGEDEDVPSPVRHADPIVPSPSAIEPDPAEDLSSTLRKTRDEDRKKGKAVSRQLAIWDALLDARIRLQKSSTAANKLTQPSRFAATPEGRASLDTLLSEALSLSDELFDLQEGLLLANESIQPPARKKRKTSPSEADLFDATRAAAALESAFHPHLVPTLQKWSAKIQAVAPSVLLPSTRNAFSKAHAPKSAVQLVDDALGDHAKLLKRTRTRRAAEDDDLEDVEVFDDTDFYQQLLRDVIDARGNGVGGADDWMLVQKQKKAQKKKKVDTKASKGRKLRYEVHEKLQNFMVPVPVQHGGWHEEQIDELFASLLGKGFEGAGADEDPEADGDAARKLEHELGEAMKGGFRVFG
ncbi:hypothetical protein PLICRDRAFT_44220 [Plicaturopsis crispa FD-325 SS-3]|nr:hypothetical protein PLICRDRAFT_44220 [Plicaturopsis crispa FD-325 SS-3]